MSRTQQEPQMVMLLLRRRRSRRGQPTACIRIRCHVLVFVSIEPVLLYLLYSVA